MLVIYFVAATNSISRNYCCILMKVVTLVVLSYHQSRQGLRSYDDELIKRYINIEILWISAALNVSIGLAK
jgi:hypothetical protein